MSSEVRENAEDLFSEALKATDDLYNVRDTDFSANPDEKALKHLGKVNLALQLIDEIPLENAWNCGARTGQEKNYELRADFFRLASKLYEILGDGKEEGDDAMACKSIILIVSSIIADEKHKNGTLLETEVREAIGLLARARKVKLNPSLADAWLILGNCIWKKGDLASANNCYTLSLSKGPSKSILCQLSMLERIMTQDKSAEDQVKIVEESIKHAKEVITLDVQDGNSW